MADVSERSLVVICANKIMVSRSALLCFLHLGFADLCCLGCQSKLCSLTPLEDKK